ncbi:MAG: alpha-amylase family glycosyl hydrolase, partial [Waddliaceae bacterium]
RAASDFLFIPSKFEPCGLVQFEGWNYGSLVLGANTGGLADTVVPIEENDGALKGNGFLFERKRGSPNEFEHVIGKALRFWKQLDSAAQQKLVSRVMEEGRQYSWKTSPNGLSPSVKYRCVYELAKREVGMRRASLDEHFSVECLKRKISVQGCAEGTSRKSRAEEKYMQKYYSEKGVTDPEELERLFLAIPQSSRKDFPSPYWREVDYRQYERQGAFYNKGESQFTVFAPNAEDVKVVFYDDNEELLGTHSMSKQPNGEWKVTVNDNAIKPGVRYHYQVNNKCKLDPYGRMQRASKDPNKDPYSVLVDSQHTWNDGQWMAKRADSAGQSKPMSVYEIHPMTWKKKDGKPLNYKKLAEELVAHCQDQGYTHIELMGILEHPYEGSWGYQVTGYFSPTSRMGTPDDFKYMIDYLHRHNIGVIVDWVPAHFAKDKSGLGEFDGSPLYEATGIRHFFSIRNLVFNWGKHFDFRKKAVREFLASSAYFWLKEMHVDGLRVDAVRSVLSSEDSSSSRKFLKDLNAIVHKRCDGAFTVAEDYSGDTRLTLTPFDQGLDFNMKWHIGWTRKTLNFFRSPLEQRCANYKSLVAAVGCDNFHRQMMV